jgi:hypothetical protein
VDKIATAEQYDVSLFFSNCCIEAGTVSVINKPVTGIILNFYDGRILIGSELQSVKLSLIIGCNN